MKRITALIILLFVLFGTANVGFTDEGMYPLSEISKLNLKAKGLKLDPKELYNPNGVSLTDAIVSLGGCSGSFVSADGLILTNHHCVFGYVQRVSSVEKNYIDNGFLARTREEEIPAKGLTVTITESYRDVSTEVLSAISDTMSYGDRSKALRAKMQEIKERAEAENPGMRAQVSEMFQGRSYVLFLSRLIKDARLVYVPPRTIGEFGGEEDNWMWPRHTGDFSFIRAYVAKDGSPAEYAPDNVPFKPKRFLKVQPKGVDEGDFVFILGYPGRTNRHKPAGFISYEQKRLRFIADVFDKYISIIKEGSAGDKRLEIMYASREKGLANNQKRSRGQELGITRIDLLEKKNREDAELADFIQRDASLREQYGSVLSQLSDIYRHMQINQQRELILDELRRHTLLAIANSINTLVAESSKPDSLRREMYQDKNLPQAKERVLASLKTVHTPIEFELLREVLNRAAEYPPSALPEQLSTLFPGVDKGAAVSALIERLKLSALTDSVKLAGILENGNLDSLVAFDPLIHFTQTVRPLFDELNQERMKREGALLEPSAKYVEVKEKFLKRAFIPDANSTLRLTYGYVRGYTPRDAVFYKPISTLSGVVEKTTGVDPFISPRELVAKSVEAKKSEFANPQLKDVPVGLLYNTDTTGGNSGSAVMNARGELIGVNFDRTFEATINDFEWNENYSRSIAVDVRYILWVTKYIGGADFLLAEMGVGK